MEHAETATGEDGRFRLRIDEWADGCVLSARASPGLDPSAPSVDVEVAATLVVVRGCRIACEIEVSADGRKWRRGEIRPAAGGGADGWVDPGRLRYVRIAADDAASITEAAVWA